MLLCLAFCVLLSLVSAGCPDVSPCDVGEHCCACVSQLDGDDYYCSVDCIAPTESCPDESEVLENEVEEEDEIDHEDEDDGEKSECGCFSAALLENVHPEDHSDHYDGDDREISRPSTGSASPTANSNPPDSLNNRFLMSKRLEVDVCPYLDEFSACATERSCASKYLGIVCSLKLFGACAGCNGVEASDPDDDRTDDELLSGIQTLKSSIEDYIENQFDEIESIDITYIPGTKEIEVTITASDENRDNSDLPEKVAGGFHSVFDVEDGTFEIRDVEESKKRLRLAQAHIYVHNENSSSGLVVGLFAIVLAFRALF